MSQDPWSWYARMVESDRNMQQQGVQNLMSGLNSAVGSVAGAYTDKAASAQALKGMDETMGAMADMGAITTDFRDRYMKSDEAVRPFIFQALASPMFNAHLSGMKAEQAAMAQQRVWGGGGGGGGGGGDFTY